MNSTNKSTIHGGVPTPWGASQGKTLKMAIGLCFYSTAGHGGVAVSFSLAMIMSAWARQQGVRYGGRWWYEEDTAWAIPVFELYDKVPALRDFYEGRNVFDIKTQAEQVLRRWHPDCPALEEIPCATN
jgi:hypothetical protein